MLKYKPVGYRILVKPDKVEEVSKGGIIIAEETRKAEQHATNMGTVMEVGQQAYIDIGDKQPWCKVGQKVVFSKFSGLRVFPNLDNKDDFLLVLNDQEVIAVAEEDNGES